ncbi:MAG: hypothetical protein COB36_04805 [Alphaproteobacteria bacterium]|nr:MAG: hypothetical protein COB36_04805 [Alphaproteobacteria bacterium]
MTTSIPEIPPSTNALLLSTDVLFFVGILGGWSVYTIFYLYRKRKKVAWKKHREFNKNYFSFFKNPLSSGLGILTFFLIIALGLTYQSNPENKNVYAIIISAALAAMGWIIHVKHNTILQRRRQIFDLLKDLKIKHHVDFMIINKYKAPHERFADEDMDKLLTGYKCKNNYEDVNSYPPLWAIIRVANSYERTLKRNR